MFKNLFTLLFKIKYFEQAKLPDTKQELIVHGTKCKLNQKNVQLEIVGKKIVPTKN